MLLKSVNDIMNTYSYNLEKNINHNADYMTISTKIGSITAHLKDGNIVSYTCDSIRTYPINYKKFEDVKLWFMCTYYREFYDYVINYSY